jgi:hypothetical protein
MPLSSSAATATATERLAALLDDRDFVTRTLSEVTGEPLAAVEARLDAEEQDTGINVTEDVKARNLKMGVWSDDLIKFYQVCFFFYGLAWLRVLFLLLLLLVVVVVRERV